MGVSMLSKRPVAANLNLIFVLVVRRLFPRKVFAAFVDVSCSVRFRRRIFYVSGWFFVLSVLVCVRLRQRLRMRLRPYSFGLGHAREDVETTSPSTSPLRVVHTTSQGWQ